LAAEDSDDEDVAAYATMRTCSKSASGLAYRAEKLEWLSEEDRADENTNCFPATPEHFPEYSRSWAQFEPH
jgi:hypothetical protein